MASHAQFQDDYDFEDTTGYSPAKFYTASSDGSGKGVTVSVVVRPTIHHEIKKLIEQARIRSYDTMADFVRDAVYHRLHWLKENGLVEDTATLGQAMLLAEVVQAQRKMEIEEQFIGAAETALPMAVKTHAWSTLADLIARLRNFGEDASTSGVVATRCLELARQYQIELPGGWDGSAVEERML